MTRTCTLATTYPAIKGPTIGPMNGEMVYTAIGLECFLDFFETLRKQTTYVATLWLSNKSLTLPPATLRNAAPHSPVINRKTR